MTRGGYSPYLAAAASLTLHAVALTLILQRPSEVPPAPLKMLQVTLLVPPDQAPGPPSLPKRERGLDADHLAVPQQSALSENASMVDSSTAAVTVREAPAPESAAETAVDTPSAASTTAVAVPPTDATATDTAVAGAAGQYNYDRVLTSLEKAFVAHFYYPLLARRNGWEGRVTLALRVEIDGRLTGIHVVGSSGYRILDKAAVDTLSRARALPLPGGALGSSLDMLLPVQYRLLDARV